MNENELKADFGGMAKKPRKKTIREYARRRPRSRRAAPICSRSEPYNAKMEHSATTGR